MFFKIRAEPINWVALNYLITCAYVLYVSILLHLKTLSFVRFWDVLMILHLNRADKIKILPVSIAFSTQNINRNAGSYELHLIIIFCI